MGDVSIRVADMRDRDRIFELLREAAVWLRDRGVDYWQNWHAPPPLHVAWVEDGVTAGQFRMVERDERSIACFRLQDSDELFWGTHDEPSVYVHSLTVERALAGQGIGSLVLARIGEQASGGGARFMRLDCGVSADGLRRYYESQGFSPVGQTVVDGESLVLYEKSLARPDR